MASPSQPARANAATNSVGYSAFRSFSRQYSQPKLFASAETSLRISSWGSVRAKSMRELAESQYRRRVTENQNPRPRRLTAGHPSARLGLVVRTLAALLAGLVLLLSPPSPAR